MNNDKLSNNEVSVFAVVVLLVGIVGTAMVVIALSAWGIL